MNLGNTIKKARLGRGLTQTELADSCNISQGYIAQIEDNSRGVTLFTLNLISKRLNLPEPILAFLSLEEVDITPEKREKFNELWPGILELINDCFDTSF